MFEKVIKAISPEWALRRASANAMLDQFDTEKRYAAGRMGRRNKGWLGRSTSANSEIARHLSTVTNRAHEFARNHWAGKRILDVFVSHAIGKGIQTIVDTGNDKRNLAIKNHLEEWSESADIEGVLNWGGMQSLAMRGMIEAGNTVVRHIPIGLNDAGRTIPFRLQGLEGAQIDTSKEGLLADNKTRLGVSMGDFGKRNGLWLYEEHPSEFTLASSKSNLIEWNKLSHLYRPERFGQVLGISWFAPILLDAKELMDLREAVVIRERTQACFAGFIKRPPSGNNPLSEKNEDGQTVTSIEPGMVVDIGEADIEFASPSGSSSFRDVYKTGIYAMAAGAGITADQLDGDLSNANYSSLRAGKIEFRRLVSQHQHHTVVPMLVAPVIRKAIMIGEMSGNIELTRDGYKLKHIMPAIEPIDPKKDLEADILAVRSGRLSPQEFITAWGRPWDEVVSDTAAFFEFLDKQPGDVVLDIDGRQPRNGGKNGNSKSKK